VIVDEPERPSDTAVMDVEPALIPVTRPVPFTIATAVLPALHVIERPVNTLPFASLAVAVNCRVCPAATFPVAGDTVTEATGTACDPVTVMAAYPLRPAVVAVIVTVPPDWPTTEPMLETVATCELLVDQLNDCPETTAPLAFRAVAVSCTA
jgi:hypothetical protein